MSAGIHTAIHYNPKGYGVELAVAYRPTRIAGDRRARDVFGVLLGNCGRGLFSDYCYVDEFFHVGKQERVGYVSYTPAAYGPCWADDVVGVSGLAGSDFAEGVERLLDSVRDHLFVRWLRWADDGNLDLQDAAKRRLGCEKRRVSYLSSEFDPMLLRFMARKWSLPLKFQRNWSKDPRRPAGARETACSK